MAHGGQVTDPALLGILPLQHHDPEFEPKHRVALHAARVQKGTRYDRDSATQVVDGSNGDVLCTVMWEQDGSERASPGWGLGGIPAIVSGAPSDPSAGGTCTEKDARKKGGGRTRSRRRKGGGRAELHPMRGPGAADTRFRGKRPPLPGWAGDMPKGWPGLLVAGTEEQAQAEAFLPAFHGLVSADLYGQPELGTRVYDLTPDSEVNEDRWGYLQTLVSVTPDRALALQLGHTNLDGARGTLAVVDHDVCAVGELRAPAGVFLLDTDHENGACVHTGAGRDADGNKLRPPHLDGAHTFFMHGHDAPLKFDLAAWQKTHAPADVWREAFLRFKPIEEQHDWRGGFYPGKWAIQHTDYWYVPPPPPWLPPPEDPPPRLPPPEEEEQPPRQPPPPGGRPRPLTGGVLGGGEGSTVGGPGSTPLPGSPPPPGQPESGPGPHESDWLPPDINDPKPYGGESDWLPPDINDPKPTPRVCQDASYERQFPHATRSVVVPGLGFKGTAWASGEPDPTGGPVDDATRALLEAAPYGGWFSSITATSSTGLKGTWEGARNAASSALVNQGHKRADSSLIFHPYGVKLNTLMTDMAAALAGCPVVSSLVLPPVMSSLQLGTPGPGGATAITSGAKFEQDSVGGSVRTYWVDASGASSARMAITSDGVAIGVPSSPCPLAIVATGTPPGEYSSWYGGNVYAYPENSDSDLYWHPFGGSAQLLNTPTLGSLTNVADGVDSAPTTNAVLAYNGSAWAETTSPTFTGLTVNGKLTVTGLIDPTGVVITDGAQPYSGTESALWANGEACPSWWDGVATSTSYRIPIMSASGVNRTLIGVTAGSGAVLSLKATTHATQGVVDILATSADTNSVRELARLTHTTSGTVAAGFGARRTVYLENDGGASELAAAVDVLWTDATATSEDADMVWSLDVASTLTERLRLTSDGYLRLAAGALELTGVAAPGAPGAGLGRLYHDSGDAKLYWHPNGGSAVDLTTGAAHALLSATHTDTTAASVVRGDVIVGKAGPVWERLAIGAANRALASDGTDVAWAQLDHGAALSGLTDDDHTQYALRAGRATGQTLIGGTASGDDLVLRSTSHATQGTVDVLHSSATTNAVVEALRVRAASSGTVLPGFGVRQTWVVESDGGTERDAASFRAFWSNDTDGNELAFLEWHYMTGGALTRFMSLNNDDLILEADLKFSSDNARDIGATGANRARDLYLAGAVKEGAWNGTVVGVAYGGTGLSTFTAAGAIPYATAATTLAALAIGAGDTVLYSTGSAPAWRTLSAQIDAAISSTQGAVLYRGAAAWSALAVGTNGQVLTTHGAAADPTWEDAAGGVTDHGALTGLTDDDHSVYALLAGRTSGQVLWGGQDAGGNLELRGTSNNTQGRVKVIAASADTNSIREVLWVQHMTTGTAAAGFGSRLQFVLEDAAGNHDEAGSLDVVWTDATDTSEDAAFSVRLAVAGTVAERFRVTGANVTVGVWQATAVGVAYGGTGQTTYTKGDLLAASAATTLTKLGVGSNGQVLTADSAEATGIKWVTPSSSGGFDYIILRDEKSSGTNGGTFTAGDWRKRDTAEISDPGGHCTVASSVVTLAAGTYLVWAWGMAGFGVAGHQIRWANTDDSEYIYGSSENIASSGETGKSHLYGVFTIADATAFELQHKCDSTVATSGFGAAQSFGTEVYSEVLLLKVA